MPKRVMAIVSGGLDSSTMLWTILASGYDVEVITFDYGQKHKIEIGQSVKIIQQAQAFFGRIITHWIVNMPHLLGSALTGDGEIPKEEYDVESQKITVVPNRNMVFIAIAANYAIAGGCDEIWYAAHRNDQAVYPDCTNGFVHKMNLALYEATYEKPIVIAPFIDNLKTEIVSIGSKIGMPFDLTWSCYDPVMLQGGPATLPGDNISESDVYEHCGVCGTCRERKMAFKLASVEDPTRYAQ